MTPQPTLPAPVSASVLCYNHKRFVVEALESVRAQNYPNLQLIVIDDCSQDDSVRVIRRWLNEYWPQSIFVAHEKNVGVCRVVNEVVALASGRYLRCVAADDMWLPNTLGPQVEVMEGLPEKVGVLYSDAFQIDENGNLLPKMFIEAHRSLAQMPSGNINRILWEGNFIPTMTALIRRSCFDVVGPYDESLAFEDYDMWLRISARYHFVFSPIVSAKYRILPTSIMHSNQRGIEASCKRIHMKHLAAGTLPEHARDRIIGQLVADAVRGYKQSSAEGRPLLRQIVRYVPWKRLHAMYLFSLLGIPYRLFTQIEKICQFSGRIFHDRNIRRA